jgi:hypothetical protein
MKEATVSAKALEIAVALTKADHTWLRMDNADGKRDIYIKEPLFSTMQAVISIMMSDGIIKETEYCRAFPEIHGSTDRG